MAKRSAPEPSPTALAVLVLLHEAPMHPYRMWQLIKLRGKDEVINVRQRTSLYQTIDRLLRADLIAVRETEREPRRPERTVYTLTDRGRATAVAWLRQMLADPVSQFPPFPAALAHLPLLSPDDARRQLQHRAAHLREELARLERQVHEHAGAVPRLFLIETEHQLTLLRAELEWVTSIVEDLSDGRLSWTEEWLRAIAAQFEPAGSSDDS